MEDDKRVFENKLSALNTVLAVILLTLLSMSLPNRISPDTGIWYAFLRGERIYLTMSIIVSIPLAMIMTLTLLKKNFRKRILQSKAVCLIQILVAVILVACRLILPQYYDAVYIGDENSYTLVASRLFADSKSYTLHDAVRCHMEGTSAIWVELSDGERVYISYGITTYSQAI